MFLYPPPGVAPPQPRKQIAVAGQTVAFSVSAFGPEPLHYQWVKSNALIPSATSSQLILPNVQVSDGGNYAALVCGHSSGGALSSNALLQVISAPPELRTGPGAVAPDGFHFTLLSDPGLICVVQKSTNLHDWAELFTVTNPGGTMLLVDTGAVPSLYQFYRAVARLP